MSKTEIDGLDEPTRGTTTITVSRVVALEPLAWISAEATSRAPPAERRPLRFGNYDSRSYRLTLMRTATGWQLLAASVIIAEG